MYEFWIRAVKYFHTLARQFVGVQTSSLRRLWNDPGSHKRRSPESRSFRGETRAVQPNARSELQGGGGLNTCELLSAAGGDTCLVQTWTAGPAFQVPHCPHLLCTTQWNDGGTTRDTARCVARMRILSGNLLRGRLADQRSEQARGELWSLDLEASATRSGPPAVWELLDARPELAQQLRTEARQRTQGTGLAGQTRAQVQGRFKVRWRFLLVSRVPASRS